MTWTCTICTFPNEDDSSSTCEICGVTRLLEKSSLSASTTTLGSRNERPLFSSLSVEPAQPAISAGPPVGFSHSTSTSAENAQDSMSREEPVVRPTASSLPTATIEPDLGLEHQSSHGSVITRQEDEEFDLFGGPSASADVSQSSFSFPQPSLNSSLPLTAASSSSTPLSAAPDAATPTVRTSLSTGQTEQDVSVRGAHPTGIAVGGGRVLHYQAVLPFSLPFKTVDDAFDGRVITIGEYDVQQGSRGSRIRRRGLTSAYSGRTKQDDGSWGRVLEDALTPALQYTDTEFPPSPSSIAQSDSQTAAKLRGQVTHWRRVSEFFVHTEYIELKLREETPHALGGISNITPEDYAARTNSGVSSSVLSVAEEIVTAGLENDQLRHHKHCSPYIVNWMNEVVGGSEGVPRFTLFWQLSMRNRLEPLTFARLGPLKAQTEARPGKISMLVLAVPVIFRAPNAELFVPPTPLSPTPPGSIRQGKLGDGYLLGALSALSCSLPRLLSLFPESQNTVPQGYNDLGVYAVRFFRDGEWRVVIVDDQLPCNKQGRPAFARFAAGRTELWALIAEKAYAKLYGSYERIEGGQEKEALEELTGGYALSQDLNQGEEDAWQLLDRTLKEGGIICALRGERVDSSTICPSGGRGFGILGVAKVQEGGKGGEERLVRLKNAWGRGQEYTGPWCDWDPRWQGLSREERDKTDFIAEEDGSWWMPLSLFLQYFPTVITCFTPALHEDWCTHRVSASWTPQLSGGRRAPHLHPQFFLSLDGESRVVIHIEQESKRLRRGDGKEGGYDTAINVVVASNGEMGKRKIDIAKDLVYKGKFHRSQSIAVELSLPAAATPYVIFPITYEAGVSASVTLSVFTSASSRIEPLSDSILPFCEVCRKVLADSFSVTNDKELVCTSCLEDYRRQRAPSCAHCTEKIYALPGRFSGQFFSLESGETVHQECMAEYKAQKADKCCHCGRPIVPVPQIFSGRFYSLEGGKKCHEECWEVYQKNKADKCAHCGKEILKLLPQFSGKFYTLEEGEQGGKKVHAECWQSYQETTAEQCEHCGGPVCKIEGRFDGRFYSLPGEGKVHGECWEAYKLQKAERCAHCGVGVCPVPGRFDGRYYALPSGEKVHAECWETFNKK